MPTSNPIGNVARPVLSVFQLLNANGQVETVIINQGGQAGIGASPLIALGNAFVDPTNTTGAANDNAGTPGTAAAPFATWAGMVNAAWGTRSPLLTGPQTVTFLGPNAANDPIFLDPILLGTGSLTITAPAVRGTPFPLGGVVAKNRTAGSNSTLQATLAGTVTAVATQLVNLSGGFSTAWTYASLGGGNWQLSQPLRAFTGLPPTEDDTWGNGTSVAPVTQIALNLGQLNPTLLNDAAAGSANPVVVSNVLLSGLNAAFIGRGVNFSQCAIAQQIRLMRGANQPTGDQPIFSNCAIAGANSGIQAESSTSPTLFGGFFASNATMVAAGSGFWLLDADIIAGAPINTYSGTQLIGDVGLAMGFVFVDGVSLTCTKGKVANFGYGNGIVYGSTNGNIAVRGTGRFTNSTGNSFVATFTLPTPVAGGFSLNGSTTALSATGASPPVLAQGITTTPANLDAAAGVAGFGGNAWRFGGASFGNTS
jgi:hypothetical protein